MEYIKKLPETPSFKQNGFDGYNYKLDNQNISMTYEDVYKGHEKYCTNTMIDHIYYVISGNGKFKINEEIFEVKQSDIIEIPAGNEFVFAGNMKLLLITNPQFTKDGEIVGKENDLY